MTLIPYDILISLMEYLDYKTLTRLSIGNKKLLEEYIKLILKNKTLLLNSFLYTGYGIRTTRQITKPSGGVKEPYKLILETHRHGRYTKIYYFLEGLSFIPHNQENYEMIKTTHMKIKNPFLKLEKIINLLIHKECIECKGFYVDNYINVLFRVLKISYKKDKGKYIYYDEKIKKEKELTRNPNIFFFGKYKHLTIEEVYKLDKQYLFWLMRQSFMKCKYSSFHDKIVKYVNTRISIL